MDQPGALNSSEKSGMVQPQPPEYQENPPAYPPSDPSQQVSQVTYTQAPYPGQSVVAVQPTVYVTAAAPLTNPVPDHLCYSIFTMLCCCWPLGIAALVFSIFTRNANFSGQRELAEKNSKTAHKLNHAALGLGLVLIVVYIIIVALKITSQFQAKDSYDFV